MSAGSMLAISGGLYTLAAAIYLFLQAAGDEPLWVRVMSGASGLVGLLTATRLFGWLP